VIRSLHRDLDAEAIIAARKWKFQPGTFRGQAAPVVVTIEMTFTLGK
jgi:TonB family protein